MRTLVDVVGVKKTRAIIPLSSSPIIIDVMLARWLLPIVESQAGFPGVRQAGPPDSGYNFSTQSGIGERG